MKNHNIIQQLLKSSPLSKLSILRRTVLHMVKCLILTMALINSAYADVAPIATVLAGNGYTAGSGPFVTVIQAFHFSGTAENVDFIEFTAPAGVTLIHDVPSQTPYNGVMWSTFGDELPANGGSNGIGWGNPFFPTGGSSGDVNPAPYPFFGIPVAFGILVDPGVVTGDIDITVTFYGDGTGEPNPSVESVTLTLIQFCTPVISGDDFVCTDQLSSYSVSGEPGSIFNWTLDPNGGTIVGPSTGTSIDVQWNDTPGGAYELRVSEVNAGNACSGNSSLFVVIEGPVNMACNDTVQLSLDLLCQGEITPDLLLEGPAYEDDSYEVITYDSNGDLVIGNIIDGNYVGELLTVRVSHLCSGISCWGHVAVEDKIDPPLVCGSDTIECTASTSPFAIGFPVLPGSIVQNGPGNTFNVYNLDACGGVVTLSYFDDAETLLCDDMFSQIIYRNWTAVDESGNVNSCQDTIYSRTVSIDDLVCPPNYDNIDEPALRCGSDYIALENGHPSPEETGYPLGVDCNNIQYFYQDLRFDICGNSFKLLRHWVILDWCTGRDTVCDQIIKVIDDRQPLITCPQDGLVGYTDQWLCTGTIELPLPNVIFECSDWRYTVGYLLADNNGNPPTNGVYVHDDNVSYDPETNLYTITNLPLGRTWIKYTVRDDCGYITECFTEVDIEDNEPPTPVCETHTVVSLSSDGLAGVFASSIDDNSTDNCEVDRVEIRRESDLCGVPANLDFGEKIKVCCEDVAAGPVLVRLRVYDHVGLYNDCLVEVIVTDEQNPEISCPSNRILDCTQDRFNLNIAGQAFATDNCSAELDFNDNEQLNECGIGYVNRFWTATDPGGRTSSCLQRLDIINSDPLDPTDVAWPPSIVEVEGCSAVDAHPDVTGWPVVYANCIKLAMSYEDVEYINVDNVCKKLRRTWTVVDWCTYDPDEPQIIFIQKIILSGSDAPEILTDCDPVETTTLNNADCEAFIDLTVLADDDCTPASDLFYSYQIDLYSDGNQDINNVGNDASGFYPNGDHEVTYFVTDGCGNVSSCTQEFRIIDSKPPTPLCLSGLSLVLLEEDESITIWANDFNLKSFDNCTEEEDLEYSFSSDVNDKGKTITCDDLEDGVKVELPLQIWVTDEDGNQDFCSVQLTVLDNKDLCPDDPNVTSIIAGRVVNELDAGVDEIEIRLSDSEGEEDMVMTSELGEYSFDELNLYRDYEILPFKNDDAINGVSTLDLVLIQKYILGIADLEAPYKLIAADINNSGSISASDLVQLRKLILGLYEEFPSNTSWRFMDKDYAFEDVNEPWEFPERLVVNDLILNEMDGHFVGVKIGDVNGSAVPSFLQTSLVESRSDEKIDISFENLSFSKDEKISVEFKSTSNTLIQGLQYTISYDPGYLEFVGYESALLDVSQINFGLHMLNEGVITFSWDRATGQQIDSYSILNSLSFVTKKAGKLKDLIEINSDKTRAEAYDMSNRVIEVRSVFGEDEEGLESNSLMLFENYPNPFSNETVIKFEIPASSVIDLKILDVTGRIILHQSGIFEKGINEIRISSKDIPTNGVLYYHVESEFGSQIRKMIKID